MMKIPFKAVSLSHQHAPVDIRELIYLPEPICKSLLGKLKDLLNIEEALIFSTCNRTEVYYISEQDLSVEIIKILCIEKGISAPEQYISYFQIIREESAAVSYLFEVAMGLQSRVLGDLQIANQIKNAYTWAHEAQMAGAFLHRLLHTIFHTNKRVQQETAYRDGAASASYAAAEISEELTADLARPSVLVIGLGEMGADVARNLDPEHFSRICLSNRTLSKAEALALETGASVLPYELVDQYLREFDVIISAVSAEQPIILAAPLSHAKGSQFVIDLAVPRSVAPEVDELSHVVRYTIDDIHTRTNEALARRQEAMTEVHQIIEEEIHSFLEWRQELSLSPTIHRLKDALEHIRKEELSKFLKNASEEEARLLDSVTRSIMNKIIKMPVLQLKAACKRGEAEDLIGLVHDLFDLEKQKITKKK